MGPGVLGFDPALLRAIAERVGTPVYVYSANLIRAQYHALHDALRDVPHRICYAVKANANLGVLKVLKSQPTLEGAGVRLRRRLRIRTWCFPEPSCCGSTTRLPM